MWEKMGERKGAPLLIEDGAPLTARHTLRVSAWPRALALRSRVESSWQSELRKAVASPSVSKRTPQLTCVPTLFLGGRRRVEALCEEDCALFQSQALLPAPGFGGTF